MALPGRSLPRAAARRAYASRKRLRPEHTQNTQLGLATKRAAWGIIAYCSRRKEMPRFEPGF